MRSSGWRTGRGTSSVWSCLPTLSVYGGSLQNKHNYHYYWMLLYNVILCSQARTALMLHVSLSGWLYPFISCFLIFTEVVYWQHCLVVTLLVLHETAAISVHVMCTPYNCSPVYNVILFQAICGLHVCLAITCHLHFWQKDWDILHATVVTWGWNGYWNQVKYFIPLKGKSVCHTWMTNIQRNKINKHKRFTV